MSTDRANLVYRDWPPERQVLHLETRVDHWSGLFAETADQCNTLQAERDALAERVRELEGERDGERLHARQIHVGCHAERDELSAQLATLTAERERLAAALRAQAHADDLVCTSLDGQAVGGAFAEARRLRIAALAPAPAAESKEPT